MLGCASCHVYVLCVYLVVCFFPVVLHLVSSCFVAIMRIHSSTLGSSSRLHLLHGLVLIPCDFRQDARYSGSHYYHCYASCFVLSLCCATYHLFLKPPKLPCQHLTFSPFPANRCLAMLPLLLNPSYSIVSCRWSWRLLHVGTCLWDITISLI